MIRNMGRMGEFLRRAASSFNPFEDNKLLEGIIDQINKTTAQASAAIDEALAFVEASNRRIAAMEKKAARHPRLTNQGRWLIR